MQLIQHATLDNINGCLPGSLQSCIDAMQQIVHIAQTAQDTTQNSATLLNKLHDYTTTDGLVAVWK